MAKSSRGYTKKQTGTPSTWGQSGKASKSVDPWGKPQPKKPPAKARNSVKGSSRKQATPDPQLKGMDYPPNDPRQWPIVGAKRPSPTAPTQANVDRQNAIVNNAFKRGGYAG